MSNHDKYGEMFRDPWKTKENARELEAVLDEEAESNDPVVISVG